MVNVSQLYSTIYKDSPIYFISFETKNNILIFFDIQWNK